MKDSLERHSLPSLFALVATAATMAVCRQASAADTAVSFTQMTVGSIVNDAGNSYAPAWGDYDGDGWVDVFIPNGGNEGPSLPFLYRNDGRGGFTRTSAEEVGPIATSLIQSAQGNWSDYDNDGDLDLFVGSISVNDPCRLYLNEGNGRFSEVADAGGLREALMPMGPWKCAWADYDNDGYTDLYLARGWKPEGVSDLLFGNLRGGTFRKNDRISFAVMDVNYGAWADVENDGDLDLLVSRADGGSHPFYRNQGDGVFTEDPSAGLAPGGSGAAVVWADFNNDGFLDVFLARTTIPCHYFLNNGNGTFRQVSTGPHLQTVGQAPAAGDYDNDGDLDLFMTRGQFGSASCMLFRNEGNGTFVSVIDSALTAAPGHFTDCAWADYDNDGFLDLLVTTVANELNELYHNEGNTNSWLLVKLIGTASNRCALGARIRVLNRIGESEFWQMRQISGGIADDLRAHFGLGDATNVTTLRIEWPSGIVQELKDVTPNQILTVTEPPRLIPQGVGAFKIQCWINQRFDIQASTNLANWSNLATVTNTTGTLLFEDTETAQHESRYYRVVAK